jgi:hypothetical protein
MIIHMLEIALAIVLARIVWAALPALVGIVFTALLAVLAPVTAIKYIAKKQAAKTAPQAPKLTVAESVDRYFAEYAKAEKRL